MDEKEQDSQDDTNMTFLWGIHHRPMGRRAPRVFRSPRTFFSIYTVNWVRRENITVFISGPLLCSNGVCTLQGLNISKLIKP